MKNKIEYDATCQMFAENGDIAVFIQAIVYLCLMGNEYAQKLMEEIMRYRRDHHKSTLTPREKRKLRLL